MNEIRNAYWVVPEKFMAGAYPASSMQTDQTRARLSWLVEQGISEFIDLTNPGETPGYQSEFESVCTRYGIQGTWQRFSILDFGLPSPALMSGILNAIEHILANDKKVYLHCMGGLGRTGTVVGCYLVHQGMNGEEALKKIQALRIGTHNFQQPSPETDAQQSFILNWGKQ